MATIRNLLGREVNVASLDGTTIVATLPADPVVVTVTHGENVTTFAGVPVRTRKLWPTVQNLPAQVAQTGLLVPHEVLEIMIERHLPTRPDLLGVGERCQVDGQLAVKGLFRYTD